MNSSPEEPLPVFPNYLQLRSRSWVPLWAWNPLRVLSVAAVLMLAAVLFAYPDLGLFWLWQVVIPVLPLVFFIAPGLWRNICPLAAVNQTPRLFSFTRGLVLPKRLQEYGYIVAFALFFVLASSRKWLFNHSGPASAILLLGALAAAFAGGLLFKGKSGWCSSLCPLLPVQRIYNQTPFLLIANSHCTPCVGCTKNCYDFNPGVAQLADLHDDDRYYSNYRKFFAAAFPGFILAFFTTPDPPTASLLDLYLRLGLYVLASLGLFFLLDSFVKVSTHKLAALYAVAALNLFYWFTAPAWLTSLGGLFAVQPPLWLTQSVQLTILGLSAVWIRKTYAKEGDFLREVTQPEDTRIGAGAERILRQAAKKDQSEVTFMPDELRVLVQPGRTLLETAEANQRSIEAGCRMGVCGADPIVILSGMENLSPIGRDERTTLERLGLGKNARMACMSRIEGAVTVSLQLKQAQRTAAHPAERFDYDPAVRHVVIVGNGIAGVTAADHVRRRHPQCEIHLIGRERHQLYNRMAITRLIYGRSAMNGLYLQPDAWYDERNITVWLNTLAAHIDPAARQLTLATGETLPYDRLILTMGSSSYVPPVQGFGLPGTFVLREAEEAMQIRAFAQEHGCRRAIIAGGGLLGLEAGYALHKLGLQVSVLERSAWLLRRQLDARGSQFLHQYLEGLGLGIVVEAECAAVRGEDRVRQVVLKDGRILDCDLLLMCAGIKPNVELAHKLGLKVNRGVVVDAHMRTSDPNIFAAGDICEYESQVIGLWPVAVEQAQVAAINAIGGNEIYQGIVPVTQLKVVGVELTSLGRIEPKSEDETVIVREDTQEHRYGKLVISDGMIVGAILLGYPPDAPAITAAAKQRIDVTPHLDALRAGDWGVLRQAIQ